MPAPCTHAGGEPSARHARRAAGAGPCIGLDASAMFNLNPFAESVMNALDDGSSVDMFELFAVERLDDDLNFRCNFAEWSNPGPGDEVMLK